MPRSLLTIVSIVLLLPQCQGLPLQHGAEQGEDMPGLQDDPPTMRQAGDEAQRAPTPADLRAAIEAQDVGQIMALLNQGITLGDAYTKRTIHQAAQHGDLESLVIHLTQGTDVNQADHDGNTPLHEAASNGHTAAVELLIQSGAEVHQPNNDGWTPLHLAAGCGSTSSVKLLFQSGAAVNQPDHDGWTSLHWAAHTGHSLVVERLLDYGAVVDLPNHDGRTPLHWAALYGDPPTMGVLLDRDAVIDRVDHEGWTSLCMAARRGHVPAVKLLLEYGADPTLGTTQAARIRHTTYPAGSTALEVARLAGQEEMVTLLERL